jgi:hypothetical protein
MKGKTVTFSHFRSGSVLMFFKFYNGIGYKWAAFRRSIFFPKCHQYSSLIHGAITLSQDKR